MIEEILLDSQESQLDLKSWILWPCSKPCSVWVYYGYGEKAWRQQHKNAASNIEQVLGQYPTKQQLHSHLPPITKTIQVRQTRHAGHCWRSRDNLINDVLLWTLSHGQAKTGRPARTSIQQLSADMGCSSQDLPDAMDDREGWQERVRNIHADGVTRWWWMLI